MQSDSIIDKIHRIRQEHAKQFNYNLLEIPNNLKEQEKKSGRKFVSLFVKKNRENSLILLNNRLKIIFFYKTD